MKGKFIKSIFIILLSLYIGVFILIYGFQEKMIFKPESLPKDYVFEFKMPFQEFFLKSEDGANLNALHFKVENSNGVVLYYHGNAGELASWGKVVQKFVELNYDVVVMDYRGYGKSTGSIKEEPLYKDAQLFYEYLLQNYSEDEIVVYGRSLGTTFAAFVASQNNPKQLILEAPFYSLDEVAQNRFPIYPVRWFLKFHFPTYKFIQKVNCPITIFHGTEDTMVKYSNSEKLSQQIREEKLNFIKIPGGNHNNLVNTIEYQNGLDSIL